MITEDLIKEVQMELKKKFREVEEKFSISLKFAGASYTDADAIVKLKIEAGEEALNKSRKEYFLRVNSLLELKADWFGKTFKDGNKELQFLGIDRNKEKIV